MQLDGRQNLTRKDWILPHNCVIPTENELVEQYKVSRITVRRAVEELCKEGLVVRHPGKGTFVTGVVMRNDLEEPRGWTENAVANGYRPSTVCTDLSMVPGAEVCRLFELKHGEERYCCARHRMQSF